MQGRKLKVNNEGKYPDSLPIRRLKEQYLVWQERHKGRATSEEFARELAEVNGEKAVSAPAVSQYFNGKDGQLTISESKVKKIAKVFGCRYQYLLGWDDCLTDRELIRSDVAGREERIKTHLMLLELLGYDMKARLFLHNMPCYVNGIWTDGLQKNWKEIKPTLTKAALELPINDEHTKTFADWDGEERISIEYSSMLPVRRTINGSTTADYTEESASVMYAGSIAYSLEYEVYKDGKRVAWLTMKELLDAFSHFDEFANLTLNIVFEQHRAPVPIAGRESETDSIYDFRP